jgi:hypothetical protein
MIQVMLDQTGIEVAQLLDTPGIVDPLGGPDYVRAVLAWREAGLKWTSPKKIPRTTQDFQKMAWRA